MENNINIGELDTLVTLEKGEVTAGAQGNKRLEFSFHSRVWAKVERNINEMVGNSNLEEDNSIELTCYKVKDLNRNWRVIVDGLPYEITAISPISRVSPLCVLSLKGVD